jgi:FixJ family two-component response regulator
MNDIIVVAPNAALRHSIVFVLESGGLRVLPCATVETAFSSALMPLAACMVVDEEAIADWRGVAEHFAAFARPVILLVSSLSKVPDVPLVRCLLKPFLGQPLLEAVQAAIGGTF